MSPYYETVPLDSAAERKKYEDVCGKQEAEILRFLERHWHHDMSASYVWKTLFTSSTPLTSVRRALSDLARKGYVEKTAEKVIGPFSRPEHTWRFRKPYKEGEQLKLPLEDKWTRKKPKKP